MSNIDELRNRNMNIVFGNMMVIINRDKNNFSGEQAGRGKTGFFLYFIMFLLLLDISNNVHNNLIKILFKIITVRPNSMI